MEEGGRWIKKQEARGERRPRERREQAGRKGRTGEQQGEEGAAAFPCAGNSNFMSLHSEVGEQGSSPFSPWHGRVFLGQRSRQYQRHQELMTVGRWAIIVAVLHTIF